MQLTSAGLKTPFVGKWSIHSDPFVTRQRQSRGIRAQAAKSQDLPSLSPQNLVQGRVEGLEMLFGSNKQNLIPNVLSGCSILFRAARVYSLAALLYADYQFTTYLAQRRKQKLGLSLEEESDQDPRIAVYWDNSHDRNSQRVLSGIGGLQGLWVKVGQFLGSRPDIMPMAYVQRLRTLQDAVSPRQWEEVSRTLIEELGENWRDSFEWVDEEPLSTASIAQVHRARLKNGEEVVIKVEHRGIDALMHSDLENLRILTELMAKREPDYDFRQLVQEWVPAVRRELDLCMEADSLTEARENMIKAGVKVIVPYPVDGYTTKKVLIMQYCPGFTVRNVEAMDERQVDREAILSRVCEAWAVQMHVNGFFNADPHPGNILISTSQEQNGGDPSVPILLDFGLTKRFSEDRKFAFSKLVHSAYVMDVDGLLRSLDLMGFKTKVEDPFEDLNSIRRIFRPVPASKAAAARAQRRKEMKMKVEAVPRLKRPIDAWPSDLVFYFRVTVLLRGLCSTLEMEFPFLKIMALSAAKTMMASVPEKEHAQSLIYRQVNPIASSQLQTKMEDLITRLHMEEEVLGIQVVVFQGREMLVDVSAGQIGPADPRPVTPKTLFNAFSVTKAFAATAVHILAQKNLLDYDDPVAKYWPEFGCMGKEECTIRQALNHEAGLADALPENATVEDLLQWNHMVGYIGGAEPAHPPGSKREYHYLTYGWLLGGIVKGVTGKDISQVMQEEIVCPLDLENELYLGGIPDEVADEELAVLRLGGKRKTANAGILEDANISKPPNGKSEELSPFNPNGAVKQNGSAPEKPRWERFKGKEQMLNPTTFNMRRVRKARIPSANGHMTAQALARFYSSLATLGTDNVKPPLLHPTTLANCFAESNRNGMGDTQGSPENIASMLHATPSARGALGFNVYDFVDKNGDPVLGLGHTGLGGSIGFAIPDRNLAVGITVSHLSFSRVASKKIIGLVCDQLGLTPPSYMAE